MPKQTTAHRDAVMGIPQIDDPRHALFTEQVKLEPFNRAMQEHKPDVWFTNLRSGQTAFRSSIDIVSLSKDGVLKVSPFYHWSDEKLDVYLEENKNEIEKNKLLTVEQSMKLRLELSKKEGFSHVMFLDIDEFWTPKSFDLTIKSFLAKYKEADVLCFEWFNRTNESIPFSPAISDYLAGYCGHHVKSLISLNYQYYKLNPHTVIADNIRYILADGSDYIFKKSKIKA